MKIRTLIIALVLISACQKQSTSSLSHHQSIINGIKTQDSLSPNVMYSTVALRYKDNKEKNFHCTGVLITENIVLTAGHCVDKKNLDIIFGQEILNDTSKMPIENVYSALKVIRHPNYNLYDLKNDLALILLNKKIKGPFRPIPIYSNSLPELAGQVITASGFSRYSSPIFNDIYTSSITYVLPENTPSNFYQKNDLGPARQLLSKRLILDPIKEEDKKYVPEYVQRIYFSQFTGGLCEGDSGGPITIQINGADYLIGINSGIGGRYDVEGVDCEYSSYAVSPFYFITWIKKQVKLLSPKSEIKLSNDTLPTTSEALINCGKKNIEIGNLYFERQYSIFDDEKLLNCENDLKILSTARTLVEECLQLCSDVPDLLEDCHYGERGNNKFEEALKLRGCF
ncbi:MAG: trypsin-like serine protease [Bacteriovoracaceae bacterium]